MFDKSSNKFSERIKLLDGTHTITEIWRLENILSQIKITQSNLNNLLLEFKIQPQNNLIDEMVREAISLAFLKESLEEMLDNNQSIKDRFACDIIRMERKTDRLMEMLTGIHPVLTNLCRR